MSGAITPLPQYAFMAWYLVKKHRDNFSFYLYSGVILVLYGYRRSYTYKNITIS